MTMIIHPHQGADRIRFGMSRDDVARVLGIAPRRFKSSIYSLEEDFFQSMDLCVMYDEHGRCNAISFGRNLGTDLEYEGYRLFAHPARTVRDWALAKDPQLDRKHGFTSKVLGLGMWADWIDVPDLAPEELQEPAMSFIIFRPGYYEEEQARLAAAGLIPDDSRK
jgi:hypothetical protein